MCKRETHIRRGTLIHRLVGLYNRTSVYSLQRPNEKHENINAAQINKKLQLPWEGNIERVSGDLNCQPSPLHPVSVTEDIISLQSYFYYWYSITHSLFLSRLKSFLFCESSLPQPFLCFLQDSLYGFPRLFTATSEHIRLFTFQFFSVFTLF